MFTSDSFHLAGRYQKAKTYSLKSYIRINRVNSISRLSALNLRRNTLTSNWNSCAEVTTMAPVEGAARNAELSIAQASHVRTASHPFYNSSTAWTLLEVGFIFVTFVDELFNLFSVIDEASFVLRAGHLLVVLNSALQTVILRAHFTILIA